MSQLLILQTHALTSVYHQSKMLLMPLHSSRPLKRGQMRCLLINDDGFPLGAFHLADHCVCTYTGDMISTQEMMLTHVREIVRAPTCTLNTTVLNRGAA